VVRAGSSEPRTVPGSEEVSSVSNATNVCCLLSVSLYSSRCLGTHQQTLELFFFFSAIGV
jgi:hypothetical protein